MKLKGREFVKDSLEDWHEVDRATLSVALARISAKATAVL